METIDAPQKNVASFRDPSGQVYHHHGRILRTVTEYGRADYEFVRGTPLVDKLVTKGKLLAEQKLQDKSLLKLFNDPYCVLEHPKLPFISYPFEWSFSHLKEAAILFLDIHLAALKCGVTLSDASAYNVQYQAGRSVYIDHLSFKKYQQGDIWFGHRQFCEQFLNPLLLMAHTGVPFNTWYRGSKNGITAQMLSRLLPFYKKMSFQMLMHVVMQSRFQQMGEAQKNKVSKPSIKLNSLQGMLSSMKSWISKLQPQGLSHTVWLDYTSERNYSDEECQKKVQFVEVFIEQTKPNVVWDLGCNTGEFSQVALAAGAQMVLGLEGDHGALEQAYQRVQKHKLNFLPLYMDLTDPTPNQGWLGGEINSLVERGPADAILALAIIHHLAISHNVPLAEIVKFALTLAPQGVIEFVPKADLCVKQLLQLREDIFQDYTLESFTELLSNHAKIVKQETITKEGRTLFWYDCN